MIIPLKMTKFRLWMEKDVSFIIPAYNASATIGGTLNSILALGIEPSRYEVIVIDDCSSDDTVQVAESFRHSIPDLVIRKQPVNGRQGAARNRGVTLAEGRYAFFVDSDDFLFNGFMDALDMACRNDADICFFPVFCESEGIYWTFGSDRIVMDGKTFCESCFDPGCPLFLSPWSGIYKTAFLREVNYPFVEGHQAEDSDFVLRHISSAGRVCYCPSPSYHYTDAPGSTIHKRTISIVIDYLLMAERLKKISVSTSAGLPVFSRGIQEKVMPIIVYRLGLWYLGKLDIRDTLSLYEEFPLERRRSICTSGVRSFPACVLKHKYISIACIALYGRLSALSRALGR